MPTKNFTDRWAKTVATHENSENYFDTAFRVRGVRLGLRVTKLGTRSYFVRYRNKAGRKRDYALPDGDPATVSLEQAHTAASALGAKIRKGNDPRQEHVDIGTAPTVAELALLYYEREAVNNQRPKTHLERRRIINTDIIPAIGDMKAAEVKRKDIIALLEHVEHKKGRHKKDKTRKTTPIMASRVRSVLFSIFRYGLERELFEHNPCVGLPRMVQTRARRRALTESEIEIVWNALDSIPFTLASFFRLLLVLGQRVNETRGMKWSEIEGDKWHLPGERAKNGIPHLVPLSSLALKILSDIKKDNVNRKERSRLAERDFFDEYVFPDGHSRGAIQDPGQRWRQVIRSLKNKGVEHATLHDLRRTLASHMRRLGIDAEIVDKILNHKPRTVRGRSYDAYEYLPEKTQALSRWARELEHIISGKRGEKVVPLRKVQRG